MNDRNRGGMTISALLTWGLVASVAIPIICLVILGIVGSNGAYPLGPVLGLGVVVAFGVGFTNYMVRRRVNDRLLSLSDVCPNFAHHLRPIPPTITRSTQFPILP